MPPKQLKDASVFSLVTSWMLPKPNTEHSKTDDKTPSPTEVVGSSQEAEERTTLSPTDVVDSPDMEYYFEQNAAYEKTTTTISTTISTTVWPRTKRTQWRNSSRRPA